MPPPRRRWSSCAAAAAAFDEEDVFAGLAGGGIVTSVAGVSGNDSNNSFLTLGYGDASSTFTGSINGNIAIVKIGSGTFTLNAQDASAISANSWYHVAVVFDSAAGSVSCYVNGALDTSATGAVATYSSNNLLKIGARGNDNLTTFNGVIDEARIFSLARSSTQILADYYPGAKLYRAY